MVEATKPVVPPMELCIRVLCGGSLTLCIESVQFEMDPVKKLEKVKKKGRYLDLPYGQSIRITPANVGRYGFTSVPEMLTFLAAQLPLTAEGRKSGPAFIYSVALGPQTVVPEAMDLDALKAEIEKRTRCKPHYNLSREGAIVSLRGLREICGEAVPFVQDAAPAPKTKEQVTEKANSLIEDLFGKYNNTASPVR